MPPVHPIIELPPQIHEIIAAADPAWDTGHLRRHLAQAYTVLNPSLGDIFHKGTVSELYQHLSLQAEPNTEVLLRAAELLRYEGEALLQKMALMDAAVCFRKSLMILYTLELSTMWHIQVVSPSYLRALEARLEYVRDRMS
ncbi:MAG: hypothetical protein SF053_15435 [Bacteroidia bacterium]|nr:hypothetical protein [Bacteroidia bacterium]